MKPETKQFIYTVWRYLLVGPLFGIVFMCVSFVTDGFSDHSAQNASLSEYPIMLLGILFMGFLTSYFILTTSVFACGLYRAICMKRQYALNLKLYYLLSVACSLPVIRAAMGDPIALAPSVAGVVVGPYLAYKMLSVRITPVDNPYAHIAPEKQSQPSIFSNIMLLYILGIPAIAALPLTLWFLDPSDGTGRKILGYFVCHLIALVALCPWMPGLYIARCATNKKPVSRKTYYLWALRSGYAVPTLVALLIAIGQLIHHDRFKSIYGFIAGYCNVAVLSMTATVLLSALFLVITEHWLKNTPFALQFAKKSPPVSATEN